MITGLAIFAPIAVMGPGLGGGDRPRQCNFPPAAWLTGAQRSRSRARNAAKTSGGPIRGSTPSLVKAVSISGEARASLIAALSLAMMAGGVAAGATTPVNETETKSDSPLSI